MNRPLLLIVPLLPFLASCRTIRHTTAKAQTIMVHDTIQQHVIVRRTDSVLIIKTDSGTDNINFMPAGNNIFFYHIEELMNNLYFECKMKFYN